MRGAERSRERLRSAARRRPPRPGPSVSGGDPCFALPPDHAPRLEIDQMGKHRAAGGRVEPRIDVAIHMLDHDRDPPLTRLDMSEDLTLASAAMLDEAEDVAARILD